MTSVQTPTVLEVLEKHREHVHAPVRGRATALLCFAIGIVTIIAAFAAMAILEGSRYGLSIPATLIAIGVGLLVVGRRMWLPDALALLRADSRPPVLYLRSFANDDIPNTREEIWSTFWAAILSPLGLALKIRLTSSMEAQVCDVLRTIGPVITASRQDEVFNLPTASRLKIDDPYWQQVIDDLIAACDLVVADASGTVSNTSSTITGPHWREAGLRWEVECASTAMNRRKLLIALPLGRVQARRDPFAYNHVCDIMWDVFGYRLPDKQEDLAFISFGQDGLPVEHRAVATWSLWRLVFGRFRVTLAEVLREAGHTPRLPFGRRIARLAVWLLIPAFIFVVLTFGTIAQSVRDFTAEVPEYAGVDQQWHRELSVVVRDGTSGRDGAYLARLVEINVIPALRAERERLRSRRFIVPAQIEFHDEISRHATRALEELEHLVAAARANDVPGLQRAIQSLRVNDQALEDFMKVLASRSNSKSR